MDWNLIHSTNKFYIHVHTAQHRIFAVAMQNMNSWGGGGWSNETKKSIPDSYGYCYRRHKVKDASCSMFNCSTTCFRFVSLWLFLSFVSVLKVLSCFEFIVFSVAILNHISMILSKPFRAYERNTYTIARRRAIKTYDTVRCSNKHTKYNLSMAENEEMRWKTTGWALSVSYFTENCSC